MDGRDALLTLARDKHYEFSSLRRAKYSSIALLYELHNQGKESFVYTCNTCEAQVETRWHCSVCQVGEQKVFIDSLTTLLLQYCIRGYFLHSLSFADVSWVEIFFIGGLWVYSKYICVHKVSVVGFSNLRNKGTLQAVNIADLSTYTMCVVHFLYNFRT